MPIPRILGNASNITYSGSSSNTWKVSVRDTTDQTVAGYYVNGTGYTDGAVLSEEDIELYFENNGSTLDIAAGDTFTITHDSITTIVYLPAVTVDTTVLYVDSNGVCFTDKELTTPADTITNITNETLTASEAQIAGSGAATAETITITEAEAEYEVGETLETVSIAEVEAEYEVGETLETILITEAEEKYDVGETAETVTLTEDEEGLFGETDEDIWIDDYAYSFIDSIVTFYLVTGIKDFNYRGLKFVGMIETSLTDTEGATASVFYRSDKGAAWSQTGWTTLNKLGIAYIKAVGVEFKIALKCSDYTKIDVDNIKVRWKPVDKRYMRGINANFNVS